MLLGLHGLSAQARGESEFGEFSFDVEAFEPKFFEFNGYMEVEPSYQRSNQDGALYRLQFLDQQDDLQDDIEKLLGTVELEARVRKGIASLNLQTHSEGTWSYQGDLEDHELYQGHLSLQPTPGLAIDVGKKAMLWGKGYSWNPVAFVETPKDTSDPDAAREGLWIASFDWVKRFNDGPLRTVAFTPMILPVHSEINDDFGEEGHNNLAAKLYLLYRDTDIDFMYLGNGSRSSRFGMDFSGNLLPNFEVHGELAYFTDVQHRTITPDCQEGPINEVDEVSYLLGARYRTEDDITMILEYYLNGLGNEEEVQKQYYRCVHEAWETGLTQLPLPNSEEDFSADSFTDQNPMREYLNLRAWWDNPFDILYFTPSISVFRNLDDHSMSVTTNLEYTGFENWELTASAVFSDLGDTLDEWGEKPGIYKLQFTAKYYF